MEWAQQHRVFKKKCDLWVAWGQWDKTTLYRSAHRFKWNRLEVLVAARCSNFQGWEAEAVLFRASPWVIDICGRCLEVVDLHYLSGGWNYQFPFATQTWRLETETGVCLLCLQSGLSPGNQPEGSVALGKGLRHRRGWSSAPESWMRLCRHLPFSSMVVCELTMTVHMLPTWLRLSWQHQAGLDTTSLGEMLALELT